MQMMLLRFDEDWDKEVKGKQNGGSNVHHFYGVNNRFGRKVQHHLMKYQMMILRLRKLLKPIQLEWKKES